MKRDFSAVVKDLDGNMHVRAVMQYDKTTGKPVMEVQGGAKVHAFSHHEPLTLRGYAMDALAGRWPGEEQMDRAVMSKRIKLYDKLCFSQDGAIELEASDFPIILDALYNQRVSSLVYARIEDMLNTDPKAAE